MYGFFGGLTGIVSIMTLAAIAWDRYQVIAHPLASKTKQKTYVYVIFIWLYGLFFATLPLVGFNRYSPEGYLTSCSFDYLSKEKKDKVTVLVLFTAAWVVPFIIITTCYVKIYTVVVQARQQHETVDSSRHCKESVKRQAELKLAGIVIAIVGVWFLSWSPYATVALIGVSGHGSHITQLASMVPALFCKTASCIDPFVYAVMHPRFRQEVKTFLRSTSRRRLEEKSLKSKQCWTVVVNERTVNRRTSDGVEEVMVMVDLSKPHREDSSSTYVSEEVKKDSTEQFYVDPPSWFVNPYYTNSKTRRSTSFHSKPKTDRPVKEEHTSI